MSFRFKQFYVHDEQCAMKVGTDGVLLGAWAASINYPLTTNHCTPMACLDIGTGSGLIALMLAQRFPQASILGIDIEANAVHQANANFAASPWSLRLHAIKKALQELNPIEPLCPQSKSAALEPSNLLTFQLIISNPPYFQNSLKAPDTARSTARHTDTLSYDDLLHHSARLLADNGILSLILPIEAEPTIILLAEQYGLYSSRLCRVRGNARKPYKRLLIEFQKTRATAIQEETLTLEDAPNQRSEAYRSLTHDFYL